MGPGELSRDRSVIETNMATASRYPELQREEAEKLSQASAREKFMNLMSELD